LKSYYDFGQAKLDRIGMTKVEPSPNGDATSRELDTVIGKLEKYNNEADGCTNEADGSMKEADQSTRKDTIRHYP